MGTFVLGCGAGARQGLELQMDIPGAGLALGAVLCAGTAQHGAGDKSLGAVAISPGAAGLDSPFSLPNLYAASLSE